MARKMADRRPGSLIYEPFGLVHQWGNPGSEPLTFLAFNINPEGVPAIVPPDACQAIASKRAVTDPRSATFVETDSAGSQGGPGKLTLQGGSNLGLQKRIASATASRR